MMMMTNAKNALLRRARWLFDAQGDLPRIALGGAWLFALGSLIPLLWLIAGGGNGSVFHGAASERVTPLLTYAGWPGWLLLWAELLAVSGAIMLTAAPRLAPLKWQRIGHGVLLGWNALWALGAWRLGLLEPGFWTFQALFLSALGACTAYRAARNWKPAAKPADATAAQRAAAATLGQVSAVISIEPSAPRADDASSPNFFAEPAPAVTKPGAARRFVRVMALAKDGFIGAWRRGVAAFRAGLANNHRGSDAPV